MHKQGRQQQGRNKPAEHSRIAPVSQTSLLPPYSATILLSSHSAMQRLPITAEGEVTIILPPHSNKQTVTTRCVPELRRNLLSAGVLGHQDIHLLCAVLRAHTFYAQSGHKIGQARCINEGSEYNLYRIDPTHDTSPLHSALLACQSNADTEHDIVRL